MCPGRTPSSVAMNTPIFDDAVPHCITRDNNRSQPPHGCSLTQWSLGTWMWFWKCNLNFVYLIVVFRFSSDSAFAWMPLGLIRDKSSLLQEWLGAIIQQTITSRYYLSQCWLRSMPPRGVTQQVELFSNGWPYSVNIFEADTKWSPFCRRHVEIHFLERDILLSIKI